MAFFTSWDWVRKISFGDWPRSAEGLAHGDVDLAHEDMGPAHGDVTPATINVEGQLEHPLLAIRDFLLTQRASGCSRRRGSIIHCR